MTGELVIAPSILAADFLRLGEEVHAVEVAGAGWIHVDVMDGHFVPNITMGAPVVAALRRATRLPLDVHLMIEQPERYLTAFAEAGADHLYVHVETCPHLHRTLQQIRELGKQACAVLNPSTPAAMLSDVTEMLDGVLVMSVNPGFGGQEFIPRSARKIAEVRALLAAARSSAWIAVDGGIDAQNAASVVAAGASVLIAGTAVFAAPGGPAAGMRLLQAAIAGARRSRR